MSKLSTIKIESNRTVLGIRTSFEGFHHYTQAPNEVSFLRSTHRHVFQVIVEVEVDSKVDRSLEFFMVKKKVDTLCERLWKGNTFPDSCESIAKSIGEYVLSSYPTLFKCDVTVQEDAENYARVSLEKTVEEG